jgi:hypothetical protein
LLYRLFLGGLGWVAVVRLCALESRGEERRGEERRGGERREERKRR